LDNVDSLTLAGQAKLLRAVADKHVDSMGNGDVSAPQIRVLAASFRNLATLVASGDFRSDLILRLNTVTLQLPPLRERREDVATLFLELLARAANRLKRPTPLLTKAVKRHLARTFLAR
jgi:two-component system C4-dicarboxylate transport response regulator DctD